MSLECRILGNLGKATNVANKVNDNVKVSVAANVAISKENKAANVAFSKESKAANVATVKGKVIPKDISSSKKVISDTGLMMLLVIMGETLWIPARVHESGNPPIPWMFRMHPGLLLLSLGFPVLLLGGIGGKWLSRGLLLVRVVMWVCQRSFPIVLPNPKLFPAISFSPIYCAFLLLFDVIISDPFFCHGSESSYSQRKWFA